MGDPGSPEIETAPPLMPGETRQVGWGWVGGVGEHVGRRMGDSRAVG